MMKTALSWAMALALLGTVGCENSLLDRSLVFATHTTLGVEASVNPTESVAGPVKLLIGYNRTEGVINPVYHSQGVEAPAMVTRKSSDGTVVTEPASGGIANIRRYREPEAYSVLAKFSADAGASAGANAATDLALAQWFATGEAARILARQPGITGAIVGSPELTAAAEGAKGAEDEPTAIRNADVIEPQIYQALVGMCGSGDRGACDRLNVVDGFAASVPASYSTFVERSVRDDGSDPALGLALASETQPRRADRNGAPGYLGLTGYAREVDDSIATLSRFLGMPSFKFVPLGSPIDGPARDATADDRVVLARELAQLEAIRGHIAKDHDAARREMAKAAKYYFSRAFE